MGISALELESPQEILLDAPPTMDEDYAAREAAVVRRGVESSQAFRVLEDGCAAVMFSCIWKGRHVGVVNDVAKRILFTWQQAQHCLRTYRQIPAFLGAR